MADQLELLKRLQDLDGQLYQLHRQEQELPRQLEHTKVQVAAQETRVKGVEERLKTLQLSQKEKEVELQTREATVKKLQSQLFQVKTNKEYSTMQREIDTLKADNSLLEEGILAGFDEIDRTGKERQQEHARLSEEQARLDVEQQRVEAQLNAIRDQIAALERDRRTLVPDVPREILRTYEQVLKLREGLALVPVMEESCGGCHRRLPPQVINEVYLKAKVVSCESCNRILYFDDARTKL